MARGRASVASQPQFQIRWDDVERVSRDMVTGMTEAEAADAARAEKPMLVHIYDVDADNQFAIEEDAAFQNEKVAIGARFFNCVRIDSESASEDRLLKKFVKKAPCLVFVRPNFEVVTMQRSRVSANKIFSAMTATMRKDYRNNVNAVLKTQRTISRERTKIQRERDKLTKIDEKLDDCSKAEAKRLGKDREKLEKRVLASEEKLTEREDALYKLDPKVPAPS